MAISRQSVGRKKNYCGEKMTLAGIRSKTMVKPPPLFFILVILQLEKIIKRPISFKSCPTVVFIPRRSDIQFPG